MDFIAKLRIKIPNAVIVSCLSGSKKDDVFDYLRQWGTISRTLTVDNSSSEFYQNCVVEFSSHLAVHELTPALPYLYPSADNPDVKYCIRAPTDVYRKTIGGHVTDTYCTSLT